MQGSVLDLLKSKEENHVLPFFWQHGEDENVLRAYMRAIKAANIDEVCLEARPHPDFAGEKWFQDLAVIIDEAKKLSMKIWILDDSHFPSGQCAGKLDEYDDSFQKLYMNYHCSDVCGPVSGARINVAAMARHYDSPFASAGSFFSTKPKKTFSDDTLAAVLLAKLDGEPGEPNHLSEEITDLTSQVKNGELVFDVPAGPHRIFVLYKTRNGGGRGGYVNFLSEKSCRLQIETCYEPHYQRFGDEFGRTILGFFSDEPEIGNIPGYSGGAIGTVDMPLPWSEELEEEMIRRLGTGYPGKLLACWFPTGTGQYTADIRCAYMNTVSRLCGKNFAGQIGTWCREHGVKYIGHIVEDCDQSPKMGASQGHYFRALWGQDWAGIDDIGGQVTIGGANVMHMDFMGNLRQDGEFYHHELGKLGTSLADIDPKKNGNSMCEIFGAYGWKEGTRLMLYELNHFLARGINHFVPHAFSPKDFPDPDCPPHFYAHGKNPLYKPFGTLMKYANRVCSVISDGKHRPDVAVLYHAESEWAGGTYMDIAKPSRVLDENQIDFSYIPADVFTSPEEFRADFSSGLTVNGHAFGALIIPGADFIPDAVLDFVRRAQENHFPVFIVGTAPASQGPLPEVTALEDLAAAVRSALPQLPVFTPAASELTVYHYEKDGETCLLINNESPAEAFCGTIRTGISGIPYLYDAFKNRLYQTEYKETPDGTEIRLEIDPFELAILVFPAEEKAGLWAGCAVEKPYFQGPAAALNGPYHVSFCKNEDYPAFTDEIVMDQPEDILNHNPDFSGIIRYETDFEAKEGDGLLELTDCYESAEVYVNGILQGERPAPPYRFEVNGLKNGSNKLVIEVRTTLDRLVARMTGGRTMFGPDMEAVLPEGIIGAITLKQ